jgi:hypothetical protein
MLFVLLAVHAHDAGGQTPLCRVTRSPNGKKAGLEGVTVRQDALIELGPEDKDKPLGILFKDGQFAMLLVKGQHAGHWVIDEVE